MERVAMRAVEDARMHGRSTILTAHRGTLTARDVCAAAKRGDAVAMRIVRSTGERLGQVLAILVDILNPQRIVIGALAMRTGEMILGPAREVMAREAIPASAGSCQVMPAALGERIGDVASLCVAMGL
jgi:glucokinase